MSSPGNLRRKLRRFTRQIDMIGPHAADAFTEAMHAEARFSLQLAELKANRDRGED